MRRFWKFICEHIVLRFGVRGKTYITKILLLIWIWTGPSGADLQREFSRGGLTSTIQVQVTWIIRRDHFLIVGTTCYTNNWFMFFDSTIMPHTCKPFTSHIYMRTCNIRLSTSTWPIVIRCLWVCSSALSHLLTCLHCPLMPMSQLNYEMEHLLLLKLVEIKHISIDYAIDNFAYIYRCVICTISTEFILHHFIFWICSDIYL